MTRNTLNEEYFDWLCELVQIAKRSPHRALLYFLHGIDFTYTLEMDGNRYDDGVDLRYRFGYERNINGIFITNYLDNRPCSVLEMMVALSVRLEEHIMDDPAIGNRTGEWFRSMLKSLGLDGAFDQDHAEKIVQDFLDRKYARDGKGGLFTIPGTKEDLRKVEIWYQACWYLDRQIA